jgi:hypothetical protein
MRASSLSNAKVIDLLNHYFIAVHADGVYYDGNTSLPAAEKAAYQQIFRDLHQLNQKLKADGKPLLSVGSVHAYVLASDGRPLDALHVAEAKPERVIAMLEKAIQTVNVPEGKTVVKPIPQSRPPKAKADTLILHLTARYLVPRDQSGARKDIDDEFVPTKSALGTEKSGQWAALPSEDWVEVKKEEWQKLLPKADVAIGDVWEPDKETVGWMLNRFYPTTENNDLSTNRIDQQELKAKVVSIKNGVVQATLSGRLKMKHAFYPHRNDDNMVEASLLGYLDFEKDRTRIRSLRLVTDKATYGGPSRPFGVALRLVSGNPE